MFDIGAVWQAVGRGCLLAEIPLAGGVPQPVQMAVKVGGARCVGQARQVPRRAQAQIVGPPAFGAGPVAGGKGHGLVQKEQFGIASGLHQVAPAPPERGQAAYPQSSPPLPDDAALLVMQASPVAHEQAAPGKGDDLGPGGDTILAGHRVRRPLSAG